MQWSHPRHLAMLIATLVLGLLVGTWSAGLLARGQASSGWTQQNQQRLDELVAKDAIREQIYNYSRGLDRMDKELARQVWHSDGTTNFVGIYGAQGPGSSTGCGRFMRPMLPFASDDEHPD